MAIVQGVGYDQPSFSHFSSMSFWHTAAPNSGNEYGWVGRTASALDPAGRPREHDREHLRQSDACREGGEARAAGVQRSGASFSARCSRRRKPCWTCWAHQPPRWATRTVMPWTSPEARRRRPKSCARPGATTRGKTTRIFVCSTLDKVVALIEADFPTKLYYVPLRNSLFDTHVNQAAPHDRQLQYLLGRHRRASSRR